MHYPPPLSPSVSYAQCILCTFLGSLPRPLSKDELRLISFEDSGPDTTKKEARECEGGIYKEGEAIGADPTSLDAGCLQPPKE